MQDSYCGSRKTIQEIYASNTILFKTNKTAALAHHVNATRHVKEEKFKRTDSGTAKCYNTPKRCTDDNSRASIKLKASPVVERAAEREPKPTAV